MSQIRKKRKIVIASVLKPVDDTRMFEKMGRSLAGTGHYEVHIIGFSSTGMCRYPGITFHPSPRFARLSLKRALRPWAVLRKICALKPAMLIITTHELLPAGVLARLCTGTRLLYDVRENYFRNILYLPSFPLLLRLPLALYVRLKEIVLSPAVRLFLLSDRGYSDELPFTRRRHLVIENKVSETAFGQNAGRQKDHDTTRLLFSGTLAASTGVFAAIALADRLHRQHDKIRLTIIGYCARPAVLQKIKHQIKDKDFITLTGGDTLVPHPEITAAIRRAHFGIIAYQPSPASANTIPTKLYEYLAAQLPILMTDYAPWTALCNRYQAAVTFALPHLDAASLLQTMRTQTFYKTTPGDEVLWEPEFEKLREKLDGG